MTNQQTEVRTHSAAGNPLEPSDPAAEHFWSLFAKITNDPEYLANLDWGEPRPGHPEGTVRAHIEELERNLNALRPQLTDAEYWKLRVLIHVHDSFKAEASAGVAIRHPRSHASLARAFLARFCDDADLLAMTQWHDEPYALYRQSKHRGDCDAVRWNNLQHSIRDWDLFLAFCLIDGSTEGKSRGPLAWLFERVQRERAIRFPLPELGN